MKVTGFSFIFFLILYASISVAGVEQEGEQKVVSIGPRKAGIYQQEGIFFHGLSEGEFNSVSQHNANIVSMRHYFTPADKAERIVFDIEGKVFPLVYVYVSQKSKKIFIDMGRTGLKQAFNPIGHSSLVKDLVVLPIDPDLLSLELSFKELQETEVFYLQNPLRLVLDVRSH